MFFVSSIICQCQQLEGVQVIGTNGEQAQIDAFKHEFGYAQHMTCFIHVRRNVKDKLRLCCILAQLRTDILDDIFGKTVGTVYTEGLVDANDAIDFQEKTSKMVESWRDCLCQVRLTWNS